MLQKSLEKLIRLKKISHRRAFQLLGMLRRNSVYAYWPDVEINFGDLLNPVLMCHYGMTPIRTPHKSAEVIALGSVLQWIDDEFNGFIAGAGLISDIKKPLLNAKILAVRGKLTRDRVGASEDTILGDPGLLVSKIFKQNLKKNYSLGLVPHYVDKEDTRLIKICDKYPNDVLFIDVQRKPKKVITDIIKCQHILSSSLHGLITADSYQIPSGWLLLSDAVIGKGFKFFDYASAFDEKIYPNNIYGSETLSELIKLTKRRVSGLSDIQENLDNVFFNLSRTIADLRKNI